MLLLLLLVNLLTPTVPGCKVSAEYSLAPGLSAPYTGVAFRYIFVTVKGSDCKQISIHLANYGGRYPGQDLLLKSGDTMTLGPVPTYRTLERVLENGKVFNILLRRRSP